jgi:hypothetical protein
MKDEETFSLPLMLRGVLGHHLPMAVNEPDHAKGTELRNPRKREEGPHGPKKQTEEAGSKVLGYPPLKLDDLEVNVQAHPAHLNHDIAQVWPGRASHPHCQPETGRDNSGREPPKTRKKKEKAGKEHRKGIDDKHGGNKKRQAIIKDEIEDSLLNKSNRAKFLYHVCRCTN